MDEDGNIEPGNIANNDNLQEEITGVGEDGHNNIESKSEEEKLRQIYNIGREKYHVRNECKQ